MRVVAFSPTEVARRHAQFGFKCTANECSVPSSLMALDGTAMIPLFPKVATSFESPSRAACCLAVNGSVLHGLLLKTTSIRDQGQQFHCSNDPF